MPDYRLTPKRESYSDKLTSLDHLAYRVWQQYKASADDYGVMPDSAATIRGDNRRLEKEPEKAIRACLDEMIRIGLVHRFMDQGQGYLYCRVWQDHQKVRYPSETFYPAPPPEELNQCSKKTRALFAQRFANSSEIDPNVPVNGAPPPVRVQAGNAPANADANASANKGELEREFAGPLIVAPGRNVAVPGRVPLPATLFGEFLAKMGGDEQAASGRLRSWANQVLSRYPDDQPIPGSANNFEFWRQRAAEELFGAAAPQTRGQRVSAAIQGTVERAIARRMDS